MGGLGQLRRKFSTGLKIVKMMEVERVCTTTPVTVPHSTCVVLSEVRPETKRRVGNDR